MKGSIKNSPAASVEKSTSGKKLIQARLPFKILSSPTPVVAASVDNEPSRKRKLSSEGDLPASKIVCTSEIKENINDSIVISDEDPDIETENKDSSLNPVVKLDNIDDLIQNSKDENGRIILSPKTPKIPKKSVGIRATPVSTKTSSGKSNKLIIKLPMSNKKKRKLSEKLNSPRSPELSMLEGASDGQKPGKKFKALSENSENSRKEAAPVECDVQILEDDISLSAQICLQVTNMSEDSVLYSASSSKKVSVEKSQLHSPEDAANDSELFSSINKTNKNQGADNDNKENCTKSVERDDDTKKEFSKTKNSEEDKDETETESNIETTIALDDSSELSHHEDEDEDAHEQTEKTKKNTQTVVGDSDNEEKIATPVKGLESASKLRPRGMTPKQLEKQKEREEKHKQREEEKLLRQKEKEEKERLRKKEKEEKEEQRRREKEEKEEQKRKEKEEKEEQRRKEKEEKEKKRLAELEAKNEERRKKEELKEEERKKKDEEKRKKEQEKEEAENKKRKAAEAFTKFFLQSKSASKEPEDDHNSIDSQQFKTSNFMPFQIKGDMKLAPLFRKTLDFQAKSKLESFLEDQSDPVPYEELYLSCLKSGKICPGKYSKTLRSDDDDCASDCLILEDELEGEGQKIDEASSKCMQKYRAKFLYFHENQRPPYYGTWRKKSAFINPRRPFATDIKLFDYEVDSDDEWEEEEPGESLHGSDDEKESEDEYEVDNEFFVPHGHLSDEELQNEDEVDEDNSPEMQKAKLKLLQQEFAQEMKKKTEKIKPRLIGVVWSDENGNKPELCSSLIWKSLSKRAMIFSDPPVMTEPEKSDNEIGSPVQEKKVPRRCQLNEEQIKDLIKLVHGNKNKRTFMIQEFQAFISKQAPPEEAPIEYTKTSIKEQIDKIAEWKVIEIEGKKKKRLCWMVSPDILKQYELEELGDTNRWEYILPLRQTLNETIPTTNTTEAPLAEDENSNKKEKQDKPESTTIKKKKKKKSVTAITKFTTVIMKDDDKNTSKEVSKPTEENEKRMETQKSEENCIKPTPIGSKSVSKKSPPTKKRVPLLMSVPRGQTIPQNTKNVLISDFLKKKLDESKDPPGTSTETVTPMEVETITID